LWEVEDLPLVAVVMGSTSDDSVAQEAVRVLEDLSIQYEVRVLSAHRTPNKARDYASTARQRGLEVIIALAGGSAALPGVLASWTTLPVIGVPLATSEIRGMDALMAVVQMPPGVPVACMAVGSWGARNAAFLAAEILGLKNEEIREAYERYRRKFQDA
jgi:5-(carboxyamino)imidazole ribonucleotide mutase